VIIIITITITITILISNIIIVVIIIIMIASQLKHLTRPRPLIKSTGNYDSSRGEQLCSYIVKQGSPCIKEGKQIKTV
jgi:hypothetical protein